jgi:NDP-sugar pyrophosphorylase family protein
MNQSAIILCSGNSSRMSPFKNKFLFSFLGKSILKRKIEELIEIVSIKEIYVITNNENKKEIEDHCNEFNNIKFVIQKNIKEGMKGGVLSVKNKINKNNEILIVSSNDVIKKGYIEKFIKEKTFSQNCGKICGKTVEKYFPGGYLDINTEKHLKKIIEKPKPGSEPSKLINLVFHLFKNSNTLFNLLDDTDNKNDDAYEKAIQEFVNKKNNIKVIEYNDKWQALKYPWHILDMMNIYLAEIKESKISKDSFISKNAIIKGNVIIEKGVKIYDFAVIQGPCYIGKNTIIGNSSLVRESHIGENCCIGFSSELSRSYIRNHVNTHKTYIGDSVVDNYVNFGAGCVTGNLRHDGEKVNVLVKNIPINSEKEKIGIFCGSLCKFGVNTSFSPGLIIGKNTWTFPHLFLEKNIPENSFLKGLDSSKRYILKKNNSQLLHI